jgi:hypothetical protein
MMAVELNQREFMVNKKTWDRKALGQELTPTFATLEIPQTR